MTQQQHRQPGPVNRFGTPSAHPAQHARGPAASVTPHPYAPVGAGGTDTVAVLALVFAIVFWPAGLVLSIVGLVRTGRPGTGGRGLAVAGLVVSLVQLLLLPVLAAIAIPTFLNQQAKAVEAELTSDLRSVALAMEEHRVETGTYPAALPEVDLAAGTELTLISADQFSFCLLAASGDHLLYSDEYGTTSEHGCP